MSRTTHHRVAHPYPRPRYRFFDPVELAMRPRFPASDRRRLCSAVERVASADDDMPEPDDDDGCCARCPHGNLADCCDEWECQPLAALSFREITRGDCLALTGECDGTCDGLGAFTAPAPTDAQRLRAAAWPTMSPDERRAAYAALAR